MWGWVAQHRLIGEDIAGRRLRKGKNPKRRECVHHIDEDPLNNDPSNLLIMTFSDHRSYHTGRRSREYYAARRPSEDQVRKALDGRSVKQAATLLGCSHYTLRKHFPILVGPRQRSSPTRPNDARAWKKIEPYALSDKHSIQDISRRFHIGERTLLEMAKLNKTPWVRKSKKGMIHRTYRGKPTQRWLEACEKNPGLVTQ